MPTKLTVVEALAEADSLHAAFHEALCVPVAGDLRSIVSHACFDVAMGHFVAMRLLVAERSDVDSSVRALYRPLLETCYRSLWLAWVAPESKIDALGNQRGWRGWPSVGEIAASLDAQNGTKFFSTNAGDILMARALHSVCGA